MSRKPPTPPPGPADDASLAEAAAAPPTGSGPAAPSAGAEPAEPPGAEELERLRARAAEADVLEDRLKRAQAEFVNESKRIARQAEQDRRFAVEQVVKDLVPVAEGLASALATSGEASASRTLLDGVALVTKQLEEILARHGVELIRPAGRPFDPLAHEAILMVERSDLPPNHVADVIRPGFRLHGRVVRPAQVTVSRAAPSPPATPARGEGASDAAAKGP